MRVYIAGPVSGIPERNRSANVGADLAGALDVMRQIERDIGRHADRFERAMEVGE